MAISKGDTIPEATFMYVPWTPELEDGAACGAPAKINTHKEFKGKKVVIIAVPGAYTPTWCVICDLRLWWIRIRVSQSGHAELSFAPSLSHVNHIPPFVKQAAAVS